MTATDNGEAMTSPDDIAGQVTAAGNEQLGHRMGMELTEATPDRVVGTLPVAGNRQPYGLMHGGANAVLAETLGSVAAGLHAAPDRAAVGLELSCTHHRAATSGLVTGVATPVHRGRSTATYEIVITDEHGKRTCTARLSCLLRDQPPAQ
ncbi:PaaI family thioesterase [Parasphingorhabdus pacifica]